MKKQVFARNCLYTNLFYSRARAFIMIQKGRLAVPLD